MSEIISSPEFGIKQKQISPIQTAVIEPIITTSKETTAQSQILSEKLTQFTNNHPREFGPKNITNVWRFIDQIRLQEVGRVDRLHWGSYFKDFNDFKLFYELNPQWHGKSESDLRSDRFGFGFYRAYRDFCVEHFRDPKTQEVDVNKMQDKLDELYPRKRSREIDWSNFRTQDDFINYFNSHLDFQGKTRAQIQKYQPGQNFFRGYKRFLSDNFVNPENNVANLDKIEEKLDELFPRKNNDWSGFKTAKDFIDYFNSHPEFQGKTRAQIQLAGREERSFFNAYQKILINSFMNHETNVTDLDKVEEKLNELFPRINIYWPNLKTQEEFINYFKSHPEFHNKDISQIQQDHHGGQGFFRAYRNFLKNSFTDPKTKFADHKKVMEKLYELFPRKNNDWSGFKTVKDFVDYFNSHPEFQGKTISQIQLDQLGGESFVKAYRKVLIDHYTNPETKVTNYEKVREDIDKLFPHVKVKQVDWISFKKIDDYLSYLDKHPEWKSMSKGELQDSSILGKLFYSHLRTFLKTMFVDVVTNKIDEDKLESKLREIFPVVSTWKKAYEFDNRNKIIFDSRPERLVAIILNKYGILKDPREGINIHVKVNGRKRHSIDFLVSDAFIEFHPVFQFDERKNIKNNLEYMEYKKKNITNAEHLNKHLFHISKVKQLYEIVTNPLINNNNDDLKHLSRDKFLKDVKEAHKLANKYDLSH